MRLYPHARLRLHKGRKDKRGRAQEVTRHDTPKATASAETKVPAFYKMAYVRAMPRA